MHKSNQQAAEAPLTDSMKMFRMGLEGGKPAARRRGRAARMVLQGQWPHRRRRRARRIPSPAFAKDAGEEPEMAGIYVIGKDGTPLRLGFALGNEFSDHVTERVNYLFLAHSKLRVLLVRARAAARRSAGQCAAACRASCATAR